MSKHYLLYGHSGSYNHGAEALTRTTIEMLRRIHPRCKITLSTHFAQQDREFGLAADELVERDAEGKTNAETYAPTIDRMTADIVCLHVGGDNYCYRNWQRWADLHYAAVANGAKSILWSCSIEPEMIDSEMLDVLRTHHLITAREGATFTALVECGLTNVVKVSDIAFTLEPEKTDFMLENYVAVNLSSLVIKRNQKVLTAHRLLIDYIISETDMNIALVPHVLQSADNDYDALRSLETCGSNRVKLVSDKFSAGQYKSIIGTARFCVAARTHAAIAAYSSCVPTLAVGYSVKSHGIAEDLGMERHVLNAVDIANGHELVNSFKVMAANEKSITELLSRRIPQYIRDAVNDRVLAAIR